MPIKVLVFGEAFVNEVRLLSRSGLALPSAQQATIVALDDAKYDVRHVEFYLGFEIIIAPYRMCVLHLALQREARTERPFIILATDATHNTNWLVDGHVCEEVVDSETGMRFIRGLVAGDEVTLAGLAERRRGQAQRDVETVSALARVQFLSYLGRGAHGRRWWSHPSDGDEGIDEVRVPSPPIAGTVERLRSNGAAIGGPHTRHRVGDCDAPGSNHRLPGEAATFSAGWLLRDPAKGFRAPVARSR